MCLEMQAGVGVSGVAFCSFLVQACQRVVRYINGVVERIRDSLDGHNLESVLLELGLRFHRTILDHLMKFEYSATGGLQWTAPGGWIPLPRSNVVCNLSKEQQLQMHPLQKNFRPYSSLLPFPDTDVYLQFTVSKY